MQPLSHAMPLPPCGPLLRRLGLGLGVAGLLWLGAPSAAQACTCAPPPPVPQAVAQAVSVFSGKVTAITPANANSDDVTFSVLQTWKGASLPTRVVRTANQGAACGFPFAIGVDYLVYTDAFGPFERTSLCSRTKPLSQAAADLAVLNAPPPTDTPTTPPPTDTPTPVPLHFGNLADGRPLWRGDFRDAGRDDILFYFPGDFNWWLGSWNGQRLEWRLVGNTRGFGQIADGRPIWIDDFSGDGRADVLFFFPGDHNWWLGGWDGQQLAWRLVGNTRGFGQVADGRPFWTGDFTADGKSDVLFYARRDRSWWLGESTAGTLNWRQVGDTRNFGQLADGRPIWTGDFTGDHRSDVLFYFPRDHAWWLGESGAGRLAWRRVSITRRFGPIADGRPIRIGDFTGDGRADVVFFYPGDHNWWLGESTDDQLAWRVIGNTAGFGQLADGRPIWTSDVTGDGRTDVLFFFPGDHNWWLGESPAGALSWRLIGNTGNFGQLADGRPLWVGDFTGDGRSDALFYFPGDRNWWLGLLDGSRLDWRHAGNTG